MKLEYDVLHNFISPVTGRVLSDPDYVLVGDRQGIATPSPILIDVRLDLLDLRYDFNVAASASYIIGFPNSMLPNAQVLNTLDDNKKPDGYMYNTEGIVSTVNTIPSGDLKLQENHIFRGNSDDVAIEVLRITESNLPKLSHNKIWIGTSSDNAEESGDYVIPLKIPPILPGTIMIWAHIPLSDTYYAASSEVPITIFVEIEANLLLLDAAVAVLEEEIIDLQAELLVVEALLAVVETEIIALQAEIIAIQAEISALRLNNIEADADVSLYGFKIINLADPINDQDAATKRYVDDSIADVTGDITLTGFVTGGPPEDGVISTIRTPGDLDMGGDRVLNLRQNPEGDFDAVSTTFLWDLMNDNVEVLWP